MKIINAAVDSVRKAEAKEQYLLRGQKYLFLKNRDNLTESQRKSLNTIESMPRINLKTVRAYHIAKTSRKSTKRLRRKGLRGP